MAPGSTLAAREAIRAHEPRQPEIDDFSGAQRRIEAAQKNMNFPGAPGLEQRRAEVLARAKSTPTFFIRTPEYEPASDDIGHYRHRITSTDFPWTVLEQHLSFFARAPYKGRQSLLREGYLYAEDPKLAYALVSLVQPHHLFDEERIWVHRDSELMHAVREEGRYVFSDGPYEGTPVRLLLFDRIGAGERPESEPLHRDFRELLYREGFEQARVTHIGKDALVAELRYGNSWIPTLLESNGAALDVVVQAIPPAVAADVAVHKREALRRIKGVQMLRGAMLAQIEEQLPFDEPVREVDQEDGKLRRSWAWVYSTGQDSYRIRQDRYRVFDPQGRPFVPQVCLDFLLDSFERAAGTWWRPVEEPRGRTIGELDFERYVPRNELRRSDRFVRFAGEHPEWFERWAVPANEWVPMGEKQRFFSYLAEHADEFAPGDMVLVKGKVPWDPKNEHTHAFFVYEVDPITGVPIAVAGNAWIPSVWSWETEARRTPLRSIRHRIRPRPALLEKLIAAGQEAAPSPPPLAPNMERTTSMLLP